jgi:ABC-type uncharacterized transport system involved in gliding motility auxiliary subunit
MFKPIKNIYIALVIALVAVVALNWGSAYIYSRLDLTQDQVYTLSAGTREILKNLDEPVKIKFYFSKSDENMPLALKGFASRVEDLLAEFKAAGGGKLIIENDDPQPDTPVEDEATAAGIGAQALQNGDHFYLGLVASRGEHKSVIPAITMERERLLEYDIVRAISRTKEGEKTQIGILSSEPVFGSRGMPMMGVPPSQKQVFVSELERDYKVVNIPSDAKEIDPAIKILMVLHPKDISEQTQYALDQFVMRGGKLIAMLDPYAYFDLIPGQGGMQPGGTSSNLERLMKSWGVSLDTGKVLADLQYMSGAGVQGLPTLLSFNDQAYNQNDIATARLGATLFPFAGSFALEAVPGLKHEVLIHSSKNSSLIASAQLMDRGDKALGGFKPSGVEHPVAVRIEGQFKTAFPDGAPVAPKDPKESEKLAKDAKPTAKSAKDAPKAPSKSSPQNSANTATADPAAVSSPEAQTPTHLAQTAAANSVVLIADSDFISNEAAVEIQEIFGQKIVYPSNGNLGFLQALVDQYAGDAALVSLRTRQSSSRPLTVIHDMEMVAQQAYVGKIKELEESLQKTQESLKALQKDKGPGESAAILSKEQQAQIDEFRKKESAARLELRGLRKNLRLESEALQFWVKVVNIGLIPVLLLLIWLGLSIRGRSSRLS